MTTAAAILLPVPKHREPTERPTSAGARKRVPRSSRSRPPPRQRSRRPPASPGRRRGGALPVYDHPSLAVSLPKSTSAGRRKEEEGARARRRGPSGAGRCGSLRLLGLLHKQPDDIRASSLPAGGRGQGGITPGRGREGRRLVRGLKEQRTARGRTERKERASERRKRKEGTHKFQRTNWEDSSMNGTTWGETNSITNFHPRMHFVPQLLLLLLFFLNQQTR